MSSTVGRSGSPVRGGRRWRNDTSTERQLFRETVALVAEQARAKLPTQVNGRVESAVKLVLSHDVEPQADGTILVGSSTDPLKQYRLEGQRCECQDFTRWPSARRLVPAQNRRGAVPARAPTAGGDAPGAGGPRDRGTVGG